MFAKNSRYRKLPDDVTLDASGRRLPSKSARLLPAVSADFRHTLAQGERPDHLAYKYYRQPLKWWRICDANAEFLSPLALLGQEPIVTTRFAVAFVGRFGAPWWRLLQGLAPEVGVERVWLGEDGDMPTVSAVTPWESGSVEPRPLPALAGQDPVPGPLPDAWRQALAEEQIEPSVWARVEAFDQGWLLLDGPEATQLQRHAFVKRAQTGQGYQLYFLLKRYRWTVTVVYNRLNIDLLTLQEKIGVCGFETESETTIGRVGKQLLIPPDTFR